MALRDHQRPGCLSAERPRPTGKVTKLLEQAAKLAIRTKTESISMDLLEEDAAADTFKLAARALAESAQS